MPLVSSVTHANESRNHTFALAVFCTTANNKVSFSESTHQNDVAVQGWINAITAVYSHAKLYIDLKQALQQEVYPVLVDAHDSAILGATPPKMAENMSKMWPNHCAKFHANRQSPS